MTYCESKHFSFSFPCGFAIEWEGAIHIEEKVIRAGVFGLIALFLIAMFKESACIS